MNESKDSRRLFVLWEAQHDNGWSTAIERQMDGSVVASTRRRDERFACYVGQDLAHAHAAVLAWLRWKTDHRRCTDRCTDWHIREYSNNGPGIVVRRENRAADAQDHPAGIMRSAPLNAGGRPEHQE